MDPIELRFGRGFRIWYVTDYNGPLIIVAGIDAILVKDESHKTWEVVGNYASGYVSSPFLSDIFGLCAPLIREELSKYPVPKWEDKPVEIEISRVKILYY